MMLSTKKGISACVWLGAVLALSSAAELAAQTKSPIRAVGGFFVQEETGELPAGTRLRVSAAGAIRVQGAAIDAIEYRVVRRVKAASAAEAERLLESARVVPSRTDDTVSIRVEGPACRFCGFMSEIRIQAPHATQEAVLSADEGSISIVAIEGRVNAETSAGSIDAETIGSGVRAATAGGPITLGAIGGPVRCETAGGRITVRAARGEAVLSTSGGTITVGQIQGSLRAETAGGSIRVEQVSGSVAAGTSGGAIYIGEAQGRVIAESAGGSIEIGRAPQGVSADTASGHIRLSRVSGGVRAEALSGNIEAIFVTDQPIADSLLETSAGSVVVILPRSVRLAIEATVDLARSAGQIRSDFSEIEVTRAVDAAAGGQLRAVGAINGGGPVLRIRSSQGPIEIRRAE